MRRRLQSKHRICIMMSIAALAVAVYLLAQYLWYWEWLTESLATVLAIIAAVAFWLEYHENKVLNEAQFIMDLNQQFIGDDNLSDIEWELEKFSKHCDTALERSKYEADFRCKFDADKKNRQHLVNYLVHLEGIAALIKNGVIHLDAIDDLMSYRYFIAVNNPVVQELELIPYRDYYKGCFDIYRDWVNHLKRQQRDIPMYNKVNDLVDRYIAEQKIIPEEEKK